MIDGSRIPQAECRILNQKSAMTKEPPAAFVLESLYPMSQASEPLPLYCPTCAREVTDPLICGDCSAVICRVCGTPLEAPADLGMG
jgi:hypothetical protein